MGILRFNYRSEALGKFVDITMTFPTDNYSFYTDASPKKASTRTLTATATRPGR